MIPLLLASLLWSPSATAIVAIAEGDHEPPIAEALKLEPLLLEEGFTLISADQVRERFGQVARRRGGLTLEEANQRAAQAREVRLEGELERASDALEMLIDEIERHGSPTPALFDLVAVLYVQAAEWRLGTALADETGRAESTAGQNALAHLRSALTQNPGMALDAARYPPKMRRLLEEARVQVQASGLAGLVVTSFPSGATVYLDGRALGITPLNLVEAAPKGEHRLWLELGEARSSTRLVVLDSEQKRFDIDVYLEAALDAEGPSLRFPSGASFDPDRAAALIELAQADELVFLTSEKNEEGPPTLIALRVGADGQPLSGAQSADIRELAAGLRSTNLPPRPTWLMPVNGASDTVASVSGTKVDVEAEADDNTLLWVATGAGAAGVVAVLAVGVTTAAVVSFVLFGNPPPAEGQFSVEVQP